MSLLSLLIYIPLQVLFIPLAIVGVVLVAYKQMVVSKRFPSSLNGSFHNRSTFVWGRYLRYP